MLLRSFVLLAILGLPGGLLAQALAVVVFASGERAHVKSGQFFDLEVQDLIRAGEAIHTGTNGKVSIQCSTGVIFQIGSDSRISIEEIIAQKGADSVRLNLEEGNAAAILSKTSGKTSLIIRTPTATASVRGTEFLIEADEEETSVSVDEGEVEVQDGSGKSERVRPGRFLRARRKEAMKQEPVDENRKKRLRVLDEFRSKREDKFAERVERLRNAKPRIQKRRDEIRRNRKDRLPLKEDRRDRKDLKDNRKR